MSLKQCLVFLFSCSFDISSHNNWPHCRRTRKPIPTPSTMRPCVHVRSHTIKTHVWLNFICRCGHALQYLLSTRTPNNENSAILVSEAFLLVLSRLSILAFINIYSFKFSQTHKLFAFSAHFAAEVYL